MQVIKFFFFFNLQWGAFSPYEWGKCILTSMSPLKATQSVYGVIAINLHIVCTIFHVLETELLLRPKEKYILPNDV
jgi:hypothetical protein